MKKFIPLNLFAKFRFASLTGISLYVITLTLLFTLNFQIIPTFIIIGALFASNFILYAKETWVTRLNVLKESTLVGSIIIVDLLCISYILILCGGPTNPCSIFFLVYTVMAAVILGRSWTWFTGIFSSFLYAGLFLFFPHEHIHDRSELLSIHLFGMWFVFLLVSIILCLYLTSMVDTLSAREKKIEELKRATLYHEKITLLATLSAGAAHKLNTPLSTIAVAAGELQKNIEEGEIQSELLEDVTLIRNEIHKCKNIILDIVDKAADQTDGSREEVVLEHFCSDILEEFNEYVQKKQIATMVSPYAEKIRLNRKAIFNALGSLLRNALESSTHPNVFFSAEVVNDIASRYLTFTISDDGQGIPEDNLKKLGEPFFTTKLGTKNMGLGIYLARLTVEQHGGSLKFFTEAEQGTKVILSLPLSTKRDRTVNEYT
jgi:two-component system, sensor histidine kinase RegB